MKMGYLLEVSKEYHKKDKLDLEIIITQPLTAQDSNLY